MQKFGGICAGNIPCLRGLRNSIHLAKTILSNYALPCLPICVHDHTTIIQQTHCWLFLSSVVHFKHIIQCSNFRMNGWNRVDYFSGCYNNAVCAVKLILPIFEASTSLHLLGWQCEDGCRQSSIDVGLQCIC